MTREIPERPDWVQLKKQAKDLRKSGAHATLAEAQRALAQDYGFASWAKLKRHVEARTAEGAEAALIEAALAGDERRIGEVRERAPVGLHAACALGDLQAVRRGLEADPALAAAAGGPRRWPPLLYLAFGRCGADAERAEAARLLLERGADPNSSWVDPIWPGSPETALYGATGVNDRPRLARALLEAGADPNDGESRYHAAEHHHLASLEVLAEFGTDFSRADPRWDNTALYFLFGTRPPAPEVAAGIRWILEHGADPRVTSHGRTPLHRAIENGWDREMVELLLDRGADPRARQPDGRTPYALAVRAGREGLAALLRERGFAQEIGPQDELRGACLRGDEGLVRRLLDEHPDLAGTFAASESAVAHEAAADGRVPALRLAAELGFDLSHSGRDGVTPLHRAGWNGWSEAVRFLAEHGADPNARDATFKATPLGWVAHGSLHRRNPEGDYGAAAGILARAGAAVPADLEASPGVLAALGREAPA
jgi:ankyrin repeat protein